MTNTQTLSHACYLALGAELGDIDVQQGTDANRALHDAGVLVLRLFKDNPQALNKALKSIVVPTADASLNSGSIAGMLGMQRHPQKDKKVPLAATVIEALMVACNDAHARRNGLLASHTATLDTLASPDLEKALGCGGTSFPRHIPGAAFLNFLTHEGVAAWLLDAVRPDGVHAEHGFDFGDIGDLWANAVQGMPMQGWCRAMGTGAVAWVPVHAQALHFLMHTADAEYAQGAKHLRLGVYGQGVQALPLLDAGSQWVASTRAMMAASGAAKEVAKHAPLVGLERLVRALSEGYTHAVAVGYLVGIKGVDVDLQRWANEVNDWVDVLDARKSPLAGKVLPVAMSARSAERMKASLNSVWSERLATTSNNK